MRRRLRTVVAAAVATLGAAALLPLGGSAGAATTPVAGVTLNGYEAAVVAAVNSARAAHGVRALTVVAGATDVARTWSWHLAGAQQLSHNPSLISNLEHAGCAAWTAIAENVGMAAASSPSTLMSAYMNSAPHRANILDPSMRYIGVGVVQRGSTAWNTIDFVDAYSSTYGRTRVPPDGLSMDTTVVRSSATLASLESPDERVGSTRAGGVSVSLPHFSGPTSGNDYASVSLTRTGTGRGDVYLRDAVDLSHARALQLQLSARTTNGRAVSVQVLAAQSYGTTATLGTVSVGGTGKWFTLALPSGARLWRNTILLRVSSSALTTVGGKATLAVYAVTAAV